MGDNIYNTGLFVASLGSDFDHSGEQDRNNNIIDNLLLYSANLYFQRLEILSDLQKNLQSRSFACVWITSLLFLFFTVVSILSDKGFAISN